MNIEDCRGCPYLLGTGYSEWEFWLCRKFKLPIKEVEECDQTF